VIVPTDANRRLAFVTPRALTDLREILRKPLLEPFEEGASMVGQTPRSKAVRAGAGRWEPTLLQRRRLVPRSTTTTGRSAASETTELWFEDIVVLSELVAGPRELVGASKTLAMTSKFSFWATETTDAARPRVP
jgi:hypothetical protein